MGKQYNKILKRKRRKEYLRRQKAKASTPSVKKSSPAKKAAAKKAAPAKKAAAKKTDAPTKADKPKVDKQPDMFNEAPAKPPKENW